MRLDEWIATASGLILRAWDALLTGVSTLTVRELGFFGIVFVLGIIILWTLRNLESVLRARLSALHDRVHKQELAVEQLDFAVETLKAAVQRPAVEELKAAVQEAVEELEAAVEKLDGALAREKSGDS